jgi:hypothetical protein
VGGQLGVGRPADDVVVCVAAVSKWSPTRPPVAGDGLADRGLGIGDRRVRCAGCWDLQRAPLDGDAVLSGRAADALHAVMPGLFALFPVMLLGVAGAVITRVRRAQESNGRS